MAWLNPSGCGKHRRGDDHKDKPTLDRTPATRVGSRKVGLARRPNARSWNDRSPKGSKSGKDLFRSTKPHGYTLEGSDVDARESPSLGHTMGDKKKAKAIRVLPLGKPSEGVFYSSTGSGATVGDQY